IPDGHRTSTDPAASIGRWQRDLTPDQIQTCEVAFGPLLRAFDYATNEGSPNASSRARSERQKLEVERGRDAMAALLDDADGADTVAGAGRLLLDARFGHGKTGTAFLCDGWSKPEQTWVWSCAREATVRLPAIRGTGGYRLRIVLTPLIDTELLPQ